MKPVLCVLGFWVFIAAFFAIAQNPVALGILVIVVLFFAFCFLSYLIYDTAKDHFNAK